MWGSDWSWHIISMCVQSPINLIECGPQKPCPWLFSCLGASCQHLGLFETPALTAAVLVLLVPGVMFSNFAGLSAGIYKVPLLMGVLNYSTAQANFYTYPIVLGAGLANFILLIWRRLPHPSRVGTVIDYNLVVVLIPCVCIGSAVGAICVNFVPLMVQDIVQLAVFVLFSGFFFWRWATFRTDLADESANNKDDIVLEMMEMDTDSERPSSRATKETVQQHRIELNKLILYESGYHWRDILVSVLVFAFFELVALTVSGVIIVHYPQPPDYLLPLGLAILGFVVLFLVFIYLVFRHTKARLENFRRIKYAYDLELDDPRQFALVVAGSLLGGFLQGLLGIGAGDCMIAALLLIRAHPLVASATVGYQMVFMGLTDTILALGENNLTWVDLGVFFGVCFVLGGALTVLIYHYLWNKPLATRVVLLVVALLSVLNVLGIIPNLYFTEQFYEYSWTSPKYCPS